MASAHIPVLRKEVLSFLNPKPGEVFVDGTINGGGHSRAILERIAPGGTLIGMDMDCDLASAAGKALTREYPGARIAVECANYADMGTVATRHGIAHADGILLDLGFSSYHVDASGRGFSFLRDEPLDMRYDAAGNPLTAAEIVNTWPEEKLADVIARYGEERRAPKIAAKIAQARRRKNIATTGELVAIIAPGARRGRRHPATRTFQALRIAVNRELESLERALPEVASLLAPGGRVAVISFHSLEDRIVKIFMKEQKKKGIFSSVTGHPVRPSRDEIRINPRSRAARLRGAIKETS